MRERIKRENALSGDASKELSSALSFIADAVKTTLGPGGRPFGFDKFMPDRNIMPSFTKDGLTVLKALSFDHPAWQAVLQYCKQASALSVMASGDGTTSTIVLADKVCQGILKSNVKYPQAYARQVVAEANRAIAAIRAEALRGDDVVRAVALTSANGDEELTDVVLEAIKHTSSFGSIQTIKNPTVKERYKITRVDGYSGVLGYNYNQTFATSANPAAASNQPIVWRSPVVALFNGHLLLEDQIEPILRAWQGSEDHKNRPLLVVAHDIGDQVVHKLLVLNRKLAGIGSTAAVFMVCPRMTAEMHSSLQVMRDLASYCGISEQGIIDGGSYKNANVSHFGTCDMVRIGMNTTAFMGRASNHWVVERVAQNQAIVDAARADADREFTRLRNAELAEGLVKVEIGGGSSPDLQERDDRFDDASKAAIAAMKNGALPGAGSSYIRAGQLAKVGPVLNSALEAVVKQVFENFGEDIDTSYYAPEAGKTSAIIDGQIKYVDAVDARVLDSVDTVCAVIQNGVQLGVSIATIGGYSFRRNEDAPEYE